MKKIAIALSSLAFLSLAACGGADGEKGEDGENGADGANGTDGENGADGTNGENGVDGMDGTGCELNKEDDGSVTITCGADSTTISSMGGSGGAGPVDGVDGEDGEDGTSCTVVDNGDGSATISCTDGTSTTVYDGADGADGADGTDGADGADGADGGGVLAATDTSSSTTDLGDTECVAYDNLEVSLTVPSSGQIVVTGTAWLQIDHTAGSVDAGTVGIATAQDACPSDAVRSGFTIPENISSSTQLNVSVPANATFSVDAGTHTYYLTGRMTAGFNQTADIFSGDRFWYSTVTAVFIPD